MSKIAKPMDMTHFHALVNRKSIRLVEEEVAEPVEGATGQVPSAEEAEDVDANAPIDPKGPSDGISEELFVPSPDTLGEIDDYKFTDLLNRFRASPSFTEGEVRDQFDKYWASLTSPERHFVYIAMLGFTQITLKGATATEAVHPHTYNLRMAEGGAGNETVEVVDGAIPPADKALQEPSDQFFPIVVGESHKSRKWLQENSGRIHRT